MSGNTPELTISQVLANATPVDWGRPDIVQGLDIVPVVLDLGLMAEVINLVIEEDLPDLLLNLQVDLWHMKKDIREAFDPQSLRELGSSGFGVLREFTQSFTDGSLENKVRGAWEAVVDGRAVQPFKEVWRGVRENPAAAATLVMMLGVTALRLWGGPDQSGNKHHNTGIDGHGDSWLSGHLDFSPEAISRAWHGIGFGAGSGAGAEPEDSGATVVASPTRAQENFVQLMEGKPEQPVFSVLSDVVLPEIPLAEPWGDGVADHYSPVDPDQLYCEVNQCAITDSAERTFKDAQDHIASHGYQGAKIFISQGLYPNANPEFQSVTFAVVKIPDGDNLVLWRGGVDEGGNLFYGNYPDIRGGEGGDARLFELWLPAGVTLGQIEDGGEVKLMAVDESSGQPVAGLHEYAKIVGVGEGGDDMIPNLFLIDKDGKAHPDILLKTVKDGSGNLVLQVEGSPEARFDVASNQWLNLDRVVSVSAGNETGVSAEMGAMGISFDGEFYHGDMPDGGEFSAVMVENESGVGLVDKGNHFLAAAQDENGQWEWVGLNIGRMVTTAEAESAQTISLEQVWDGSYARWCDLMFGVENRTTSKDLSPQYKPKEKYNLVSLTKYGDEGDVFEVKDVKQLGGSPGVWIFHVRAGLGNGFVESMNLIGPTNDLTNLNEMVRLRQGTFSMLLEVKSTTQGTDALFTELMLDYMDKQVLVTGLDIDSLFRDVRSITHGSLKSVVIPVADVHVPQN
jgi:hypothetical protein